MLEPGAVGTATITVSGSDLATVLNQTPEDGFPAVLATARMIGLMELAASRAMRGALGAGELSVGVSLDVSHGAATPIGVQITAQAKFVGNKVILFAGPILADDDPKHDFGKGPMPVPAAFWKIVLASEQAKPSDKAKLRAVLTTMGVIVGLLDGIPDRVMGKRRARR